VPATAGDAGAACARAIEENEMKKLSQLLRDESGVTAIEYGLIAALIAVTIIAAVTTVGTNLNGTFTKVAGKLG
jgi:pilus assembly protein Flp/PilA